MAYLVDSDWVIDHLAGNPDARDLLDSLASEGIAVSIITYMEAYEGLLISATPRHAQYAFDTFMASVPVLPLTIETARRCAEVRQILRNKQRRVNSRALDLIIAATALEENLTLVSRNREDYAGIPGLVLYEEPTG